VTHDSLRYINILTYLLTNLLVRLSGYVLNVMKIIIIFNHPKKFSRVIKKLLLLLSVMQNWLQARCPY